MKILINLMLLFPLTCMASDTWYRITTTKGSDSYDFYGTVPYTPDHLAKVINKEQVIKISNLVYFDNQNRVKSWTDWAPYLKPEVHVKTSVITMFIPLVGEPAKKK